MPKLEQRSIGFEAAYALCKSGWWKKKTPREIAVFQLTVRELSNMISESKRVLVVLDGEAPDATR